MPEGPEVKIMAKQLNNVLKGETLKRITFNPKSKYFTNELFHSDYSLKDGTFKIKSRCKRIKSKGKKLIFSFEDYIFISSVLINGRWTFEETEETQMTIETKNGNFVYYQDESNNGYFSIVNKNSDNYNHILLSVGPDYFKIEFEDFEEKITRSRIQNKEIQNFLMDQKEFSGIGNYLKSDILYMAKILPSRQLKDISSKRLKILFKSIKNIMINSYNQGGFTFESFYSPDGTIGNYKALIYGKKQDSLGNNVDICFDSNKRKTYFVSEVQI